MQDIELKLIINGIEPGERIEIIADKQTMPHLNMQSAYAFKSVAKTFLGTDYVIEETKLSHSMMMMYSLLSSYGRVIGNLAQGEKDGPQKSALEKMNMRIVGIMVDLTTALCEIERGIGSGLSSVSRGRVLKDKDLEQQGKMLAMELFIIQAEQLYEVLKEYKSLMMSIDKGTFLPK